MTPPTTTEVDAIVAGDGAALLALAEQCEAATGPDRELDALIAPLQGLRIVDEGHPIGRMCYDDIGCALIMPRYTASLDAAMTLVPKNHQVVICTPSGVWAKHMPRAGQNIHEAMVTPDNPEEVEVGDIGYDTRGGRGAIPALALCAAAVRARLQEKGDA